MKTLYLIRHAKSDWGNEQILDFNRPLNNRGYTDAYFQSRKFAKEQQKPDLIISSPATRAFTTACIFAKELNYLADNIRIREKIYEASVNAIQETIAEINDNTDCIMLFGHNPGFTDFFNAISDADTDNIPTCGIMGIHFNMKSWQNIFSERGECFLTLFPKDFRQ